MALALESTETVLVVHCKCGKDRSPFVGYSFLRLWYGYDHETALSVIDARRDTFGRPLFDYHRQSIDLHKSLQSALDKGSASTNEMVMWSKGGHHSLPASLRTPRDMEFDV